MKNIYLLFSFSLFLVIFSCGSDDPNVKCDQPGPPVFISGPSVNSGASSIDFSFSINQTAVIYLVVYNSDQGDLSSEALKTEATGSGNNGVVEDRQVITLTCNEVSGGEVIVTSSTLPDNTTLYAYMVAESNSQDEILQDAVKKFSVVMLEKQPVLTFQSTAENREVLFLLYTPEDRLKNPGSTLYPAIIFLGGFGETASQGNINLIQNGSIPEFLAGDGEIPFFVFSPQHIQNVWNKNLVDEMVEVAKAQYPIDPDRIHMTGMSGGGIATWDYALNFPEKLASVIPISGDADDNQACNMVNVAAWAFHNDTDPVVGTNGSIDMVNSINNCNPGPPSQALLTLFEDDGHDAWRRVYNENHPDWSKTTVPPVDIYEWFADQSR